jgi:hypothetical protein
MAAQRATPHQILGAKIGADFVRQLVDQLPSMGQALTLEAGQVSFSGTVTIKERKGGDLYATLSCRSRVPLPQSEYKLAEKNGQLMLFSGAPVVEPEPEDADEPASIDPDLGFGDWSGEGEEGSDDGDAG